MGVFDDLGALELRGELQRQGFDDVVQIVEDLHEFDPSKLRLLAEQVYGTSHGGSLGVSTVVPDRVAHLVEASEEQLRTTVEERWGGPAYENFAAYMREVEADLAKEEDRLRLLGDALLQAADIFEDASYKTSAIISASQISLMVGGLARAAWRGAGVPVAVAGYVLSYAEIVRANAHYVDSRVREITAATISMRRVDEALQTEFSGGSRILEGIIAAIENSGDVESWHPETNDPHD